MLKKTIISAVIAFVVLSVLFYRSGIFTNLLCQHYPGLSYYYICTKLTEDEPDIIKKPQILVDYVHQNVFAADVGCKDLPPFDNLVRGVGWCDQVAHLFIRLAEPLDMRGYLVFLKAAMDGRGTSPHSIAVITPDIKKRLDYEDLIKHGIVVDVLQGVIFRNSSGKEATFGEICSRDVLDSQRKYFTSFKYELYCNKGRIFLANTPISLDSRKRRFFYRYVFPFLPRAIIHSYQDMVLDRWYRKQYNNEIDFLYFKARSYHVYERFEEARRLYDIVISSSNDKKMVSGCLFFKGMSFFRVKDYSNAQKIFAILIKDYADSPWSPLAQQWMQELQSL